MVVVLVVVVRLVVMQGSVLVGSALRPMAVVRLPLPRGGMCVVSASRGGMDVSVHGARTILCRCFRAHDFGGLLV